MWFSRLSGNNRVFIIKKRLCLFGRLEPCFVSRRSKCWRLFAVMRSYHHLLYYFWVMGSWWSLTVKREFLVNPPKTGVSFQIRQPTQFLLIYVLLPLLDFFRSKSTIGHLSNVFRSDSYWLKNWRHRKAILKARMCQAHSSEAGKANLFFGHLIKTLSTNLTTLTSQVPMHRYDVIRDNRQQKISSVDEITHSFRLTKADRYF